jgi:hypothetical protein
MDRITTWPVRLRSSSRPQVCGNRWRRTMWEPFLPEGARALGLPADSVEALLWARHRSRVRARLRGGRASQPAGMRDRVPLARPTITRTTVAVRRVMGTRSGPVRALLPSEAVWAPTWDHEARVRKIWDRGVRERTAADSGRLLRLRAARRRAAGLIADRVHRRLAVETAAAATGTGRRRTRIRRPDGAPVPMAAMDAGRHLRVRSWICVSRLHGRPRVVMADTVGIHEERARVMAGTVDIRAGRVRVTAVRAGPARVMADRAG